MAPILHLAIRHIADSSRTGSVLLYLWIFFNLFFNTILLPLLVCTFLFSKGAKRHPTLVNLCITWIFSGESSVLLFYANKHIGPEPSSGLCIAQTSLLYGITPMWSVSVFMLFWYMSISICGDRAKSVIGMKKLIFMLTSPYVAQITFSLSTLIIALNNPDKVSREFKYLYCALKFHPLLSIMGFFTSLICIGIIIIEIHLAITAYRNWCCLRDAGKQNGVDYQFFIRVLTFGIFVALGMGANLVLIFQPQSHIPDMFAASAGSIVFFIFGTQTDVLRVWCFWLSKPVEEPPIQDPVQKLRRDSFWRRSEPDFNFDEMVADLPPPPPPKSKEYIAQLERKMAATNPNPNWRRIKVLP